MMIVDYQCIMPSIGQTAACYHTKMISTSEKAKFPGMEHHEFSPENAYQKAEELVKAAVENFSRRNKNRVSIPAVQPQEVVSGLSVEAVINARAKATSVEVSTSDLSNPAAMQQLQAAQEELSSALARLMVVVERYPDLKANEYFRDLQNQLEGTENRITNGCSRLSNWPARRSRIIRNASSS